MKGDEHTDVQPFCVYFGLIPSQIFFLKILTKYSGNAELNTLPLKPLNLKEKHPVEVLLYENKHE